ncbi:MAG: Sjogren's syndrome/scleroderma autoantigen 1 family protein [Nitrososphaeria archaeon]
MEKDTSKLIAEIMRRGGTLLAEPCPKCGGLMVKYKGRTFCPKCDNITSIEQIESAGKGNDIALIRQQIITKIKVLLASNESDLFVSKSLLYYSKTLVELSKLSSENNEENSNS